MKNSSLVEDSIDFSDQAKDSEANSSVDEDGPREADKDKDVVDHEHARPAGVEKDVKNFSKMNSKREDDETGGKAAAGGHEI